LRLFEAMYVARTTQAELRTAQAVARQVKVKSSGTHHYSYAHCSVPLTFRCRAMTSPTFMRNNNSSSVSSGAGENDLKPLTECHHCRIRSKLPQDAIDLNLLNLCTSSFKELGEGCIAAQKSINLHFTECRVFLFDQCLIIAEDNNPTPSASTPSENTSVSNGFQANLGRVVYGSGSLFQRMGSSVFDLRPQRSMRLFADDKSHTPLCGGRSPAVRRTVRIRRHGSHLSSLESDSSGSLGGGGSGNWPRLGWSTPQDPFRQSRYKFIHAVKVNRMAFTSQILMSEHNKKMEFMSAL
uniref:PI3K/PI4K domain-containing protein n=1 Tax=Rodentolepis nana TaxID=102285 RepID=A0A0R3TFE3_RODNA